MNQDDDAANLSSASSSFFSSFLKIKEATFSRHPVDYSTAYALTLANSLYITLGTPSLTG